MRDRSSPNAAKGHRAPARSYGAGRLVVETPWRLPQVILMTSGSEKFAWTTGNNGRGMAAVLGHRRRDYAAAL
ncbi:MAG: hypothetical protein EPN49_05560 [Rhodanobacter sp.]|nr:MAG: hypothetical protein EPN49_05560 [Rhodanobacter sp.]